MKAGNGYFGRLDRPRGAAILIYVAFISLFLFPMAMLLAKRAFEQNKLNIKDRQQKSARGLAMNAPFDYIRQVYQRPFIDYGDPDQFKRPELFYSVGFTSITFQLNPADHSLYVGALGKYGPDSGAPLSVRTLRSVIKFSSDLLHYGRVFDGPFSIETTVSYKGGWYSRGLTITNNANVTFSEGPVVIEGPFKITSGANVTFNDNVYCSECTSSSFATGVTWGPGVTWYPYALSLTLPTTDPNHYLVYNNEKTGDTLVPSSQTWNFGYDTTLVGDPSFFTISEEPGNPIHQYPPTGAVLVAENSSLFINGPVHGRVTVVCTGDGTPVGSPFYPPVGYPNLRLTGYVVFTNDFVYQGGSPAKADPNHSFLVMASSGVAIVGGTSTTGASRKFSGGIYIWNKLTSAAALVDVGPSGNMTFNGTIAHGVAYRTYTSPGTLIFSYDPGLLQNPPPGLPETARVVSLDASY